MGRDTVDRRGLYVTAAFAATATVILAWMHSKGMLFPGVGTDSHSPAADTGVSEMAGSQPETHDGRFGNGPVYAEGELEKDRLPFGSGCPANGGGPHPGWNAKWVYVKMKYSGEFMPEQYMFCQACGKPLFM